MGERGREISLTAAKQLTLPMLSRNLLKRTFGAMLGTLTGPTLMLDNKQPGITE